MLFVVILSEFYDYIENSEYVTTNERARQCVKKFWLKNLKWSEASCNEVINAVGNNVPTICHRRLNAFTQFYGWKNGRDRFAGTLSYIFLLIIEKDNVAQIMWKRKAAQWPNFETSIRLPLVVR